VLYTINSGPWRVEPDDTYPHASRGVHFCSLAGRESLLEVLLKYSPDLEALTCEENKGLTTPLVLAAWEGSLISCKLLLEAGANPNTCASAESPLYAAAEHHAWEKVDLLVATAPSTIFSPRAYAACPRSLCRRWKPIGRFSSAGL
jgi:hypothetical protein